MHDAPTSSALALAVALAATACTGEPKVLEPRSPPARVAPAIPVPRTPLPAGYGRLVLGSSDQSLQITARADTTFVPPGARVAPTRVGDLCATPCVVDLPVGVYKLYMTSADGTYSEGDSDVVQVRQGVSYYVRAPGKFESPTWVPVAPALLVVAATLAALGGLTLLATDNSGQRGAGAGLLIGGGVIGALGGVLYYDATRGARQDGAATTWWEPLGPAAGSAGTGR